MTLRLVLLALAFCTQLEGQITHSYPMDTVFCCNAGISYDLNQDNQPEILLESKILTDLGYYGATTFGDTRVSTITSQGEAFQDFSNENTIAIGLVGCWWSQTFEPGSPDKYLGLQTINGTDTIWSYLRLEFDWVDEDTSNFCRVQIVVKELAIQQSPNVPLYAGEGSLTSTSNNDISSKNEVWVYPNPTSGVLYFKSGLEVKNVEVFDLTGRFLGRFGVTNGSLDISFLQPGCYFLRFGGRMVRILKE